VVGRYRCRGGAGDGDRVAEESIAGVLEGGSDEALGVAVGGVVVGVELEGFDGGARFAPADHGVAHGHPARVAGDALALVTVED
jgi:hypothetical protein